VAGVLTVCCALQVFDERFPLMIAKHATVTADDVMRLVITNDDMESAICDYHATHPSEVWRTLGQLRVRGRQTAYYCVCIATEDLRRVWVGCELCGDWFHPECVGLGMLSRTQAQSLPPWFCPVCTNRASPPQ
jgi:hypothetical protein